MGCGTNVGEGEVIGGLLAQAGFEVGAADAVDVAVLNACTVKGDVSALRELVRLRSESPNARIVVTGCVTQELADRLRRLDPQISVTTTHQLREVVPTVRSALGGGAVRTLDRNRGPKLGLPRVRTNPVIGIVPVSSGCLDGCTFCSTRLVKGGLESYDPDDIRAEVERAVTDGCQEIWLTGQDTSCYGFDRGSHLAELLESLVWIPGDWRLRIGMGNPRHLLGYVDALARVIRHPRVYKFVHLPIQSGSDAVLDDMRRRHTTAEFEHIVDTLRAAVPEMTLSTDLIVGYPGETEAQFEATLDLLRRARPTICNRTRFVPRAGTPAARARSQIAAAEKKRRSRALDAEFRSVARADNQQWLGWTGEVLVNERGRTPGSWMARNYAYKLVALQGEYSLGQRVPIRVTAIEDFFFRAEPT